MHYLKSPSVVLVPLGVVCVYVYLCVGTYGGQKMASDPLTQEFLVVNCPHGCSKLTLGPMPGNGMLLTAGRLSSSFRAVLGLEEN